MDDLALELEVAAELARTAGRAILGLYGSDSSRNPSQMIALARRSASVTGDEYSPSL